MMKDPKVKPCEECRIDSMRTGYDKMKKAARQLGAHDASRQLKAGVALMMRAEW